MDSKLTQNSKLETSGAAGCSVLATIADFGMVSIEGIGNQSFVNRLAVEYREAVLEVGRVPPQELGDGVEVVLVAARTQELRRVRVGLVLLALPLGGRLGRRANFPSNVLVEVVSKLMSQHVRYDGFLIRNNCRI